MASMTLGGSQSAIGALWNGFVDAAGDVLGTSGFAKERKVWKEVAGISFSRGAYNANKDAMVYRNKIVSRQRDVLGDYRDITLADYKGNIPEHLKQLYIEDMRVAAGDGHFSSYDTFWSDLRFW